MKCLKVDSTNNKIFEAKTTKDDSDELFRINMFINGGKGIDKKLDVLQVFISQFGTFSHVHELEL